MGAPYILEVLPHGCRLVLDDEVPAVNYGSEIPFSDKRFLGDPLKDHVYEEDSGIGDLTLFEERYGKDIFNPSDNTHVHQLWKTPLVGENRLTKIMVQNIPEQSFKHGLVKYIKRAESQ